MEASCQDECNGHLAQYRKFLRRQQLYQAALLLLVAGSFACSVVLWIRYGGALVISVTAMLFAALAVSAMMLLVNNHRYMAFHVAMVARHRERARGGVPYAVQAKGGGTALDALALKHDVYGEMWPL